MFEFLDDIEYDRLVDATYYAVRTISHRARVPGVATPVYDGDEDRAPFPDAADRRLVDDILNAIARKERKPVHRLSEPKASHYIKTLVDLVERKARTTSAWTRRPDVDCWNNCANNRLDAPGLGRLPRATWLLRGPQNELDRRPAWGCMSKL